MVATHSKDPRFLENPSICIPWEYDESLGDGSTLQWLVDTFSPNVEPEYRHLLAPAIRVLCTGYAIRTGLIFTFWGDRGTGKSTLAEIIRHTSGSDNFTSLAGESYVEWEQKPKSRYGARDSHIVYFDEPTVSKVDPQYIKSTSGQPRPYYDVTLHGNYINPIPYQIFYAYLICCNKLPFQTSSCLDSVARRLLFIKFKKSSNFKLNSKLLNRFIEEEMGQRLIMDCIKADLDADVKFLIDYAHDHNRDITLELRGDNDHLYNCFLDCFEIGTKDDVVPNNVLTRIVSNYMKTEVNKTTEFQTPTIREAFIKYIEETGIVFTSEDKKRQKKINGRNHKTLPYLKIKTAESLVEDNS